MVDLLVRLDETVYSSQITLYRGARKELEYNLLKYAVITVGNGELRILHGWGDQRSYFVGSFDDSDHCSCHGLTSNAFWVLSVLYDINPGIKQTILNAFNALNSKYGYKPLCLISPLIHRVWGEFPSCLQELRKTELHIYMPLPLQLWHYTVWGIQKRPRINL